MNSLHRLKWPDTYYKASIKYLTDGTVPNEFSSTQKSRFRKKMKLFRLENDELIYEDKIDEADALIMNQNVIKLIVIPKSHVAQVLKKEWLKATQLSSTLAFYKYLQSKYLGISRDKVKSFVQNQEVKQLKSTTVIDHVPLKPIIKNSPRQLFCMDLADMRLLSGVNSNVNYLMVIIDHFSKFLFVVPLTSRALKEIRHELNLLFYREGYSPQSFLTDNEFNTDKHEMKMLYDEWNINSKSTQAYSPWQNGLAERTVGTIKRKINTFMSQNQTKRYIDALPMIVYGYNNTIHSTTKYKPVDIFRHGTLALFEKVRLNIEKFAEKMVQSSKRRMKKQNHQKNPLNIGDYVRVSVFSFTKGRKAIQSRKKRQFNNFSEEIYQVSNIDDDDDDKRYTIIDDDGHIPDNNDKKKYFRYELLKIDKDKLAKRTPVDVPLEFSQRKRHLPKQIKAASKLQEKQDREQLKEALQAEEILITKNSLRPRPEKKQPEEKHQQEESKKGINFDQIYEIESILKHKKVGKSLVYFVKWAGYDESENTWERYNAFMGIEAKKIVNDYRKKHKLKLR